MYVTRPLSLVKNSPGSFSDQFSHGGPGSGYLLVEEEEEAAAPVPDGAVVMGRSNRPSKTSRHGGFYESLPFPQDRRLTTESLVSTGLITIPVLNSVFFIPVIDQPLSSNRYYAIIGGGKYQGMVSTCSKRSNRAKFLFIKYIKDEKQRAFDRRNDYQQVEIVPNKGFSQGSFHAKSIAPDGYPEDFLRAPAWSLHASKESIMHPLTVPRADGVDDALRAAMPDASFSAAASPHLVVGRWYCPYIFVREDEVTLDEQMQTTVFYRMTLEQFWEEFYSCRNSRGSDVVSLNTSVDVKRSSLCLHGVEEVEGEDVDGVVWFRSARLAGGGVGLDAVVVERMRWEEERVGWVERRGRVERVEEYCQHGKMAMKKKPWTRFRCFVLVERFALKRMDGTLIFTFDFKHVDKLLTKWE